MQTTNGLNLLGDAGPVSVPPDQDLLIAKDGTVSTVPIGLGLNAVAIAGRIKLVNPSETDLVRGEDGLFRQKSGQPAVADVDVTLISGLSVQHTILLFTITVTLMAYRRTPRKTKAS